MYKVNLKQRVIKELNNLPPPYLGELYRLLKLMNKGIKSRKQRNDYNLKVCYCGGKIRDFSRSDAYHDRI